ncbi:hypothetical protein ACQ4LE_002276 [Meloidogyne hapla]|uniref:F-box domain-containing protein n=1 Tax=Meloidogyne hapla TaxID=6305 RepID=A0A1I8BR91_MELHA
MHSSLLSLLPNETLEDIFKFVSYKNLCFNIRQTNYLFSQLSSKLIDQLYPRQLSLTITDGTHVKNCIVSNPPLLNARPNELRTFKVPRFLPKGLPPANIKFDHIRNDGRINDHFLKFLERIRPSINAYVMEIISFGKFNKNLNSAWISLDALFLKLPARCLHISVDSNDAFLSEQFFSSPFVARCLSLRIRNAVQGFDNIALSNWLLNLTMKRKLTFDVFLTQWKESSDFIGNIHMLLGALKEEAIKNPNFAASFKITIYNIGDFPISEFAVPGKINFNYIGSGYKNSLQIISGNFCDKQNYGNKYSPLAEAIADSDVGIENIVTNITFD